MLFSSRWITLIVFFILVFVIAKFGKGTYKEKLKKYGMIFVEGMVGGLIIDSLLINVGYYYFTRQPIYSFNYFSIVLPCWGVFGMFVNFVWEWIGKDKFIRSMPLTLLSLFAFYECTNLYTGSWVYNVPFYVVALGWMPLIIVFAGCTRRRKVVFKLEQWMLKTENRVVFHALSVCRYLIIIVMFPLLVSKTVKLIMNFKRLKAMECKFSDYIEYLMVAE